MRVDSICKALDEYQWVSHKTNTDVAKALGMSRSTFTWKKRGFDSKGREKEFTLRETKRISDLTGIPVAVLVSSI